MSEQQIQKVKVKRLAHVGLWSTDVVAQTRFYRQVLGFDLRSTEQVSAAHGGGGEELNVFFTLGDEQHCLGLFHDGRSGGTGSRRYASRSRLHHLSLEVDTDAELAALAARLKSSGVDLRLEPRDGEPEGGDTLWFSDPDGNRIEIFVAPDEPLNSSRATLSGKHTGLRPTALQHIALRTARLEEMVEFYSEALGFDISDWLLRECVWLRCNSDHHTLILMEGKADIDHIGYSIPNAATLVEWADLLGSHQLPILWGPGRHGAGNDLFIRFADPEGLHIEFSAGLQQYFDQAVSTPPRLWHSRSAAFNLWGNVPAWLREESYS